MNTPIERRHWIEALHNLNVEYEKLLQIIVPLSQNHDKGFVVNIFAEVLAETPIDKEDCVLLRDLALRFDNDGRLIDVFKAIHGTTERAEVVIKSGSDF